MITWSGLGRIRRRAAELAATGEVGRRLADSLACRYEAAAERGMYCAMRAIAELNRPRGRDESGLVADGVALFVAATNLTPGDSTTAFLATRLDRPPLPRWGRSAPRFGARHHRCRFGPWPDRRSAPRVRPDLAGKRSVDAVWLRF